MFRKRHHHHHSPDPKKRHHRSPQPEPQPQPQPRPKTPVFTSYLDFPNLPPDVKLLCEIIATTPASAPSLDIEKALNDTGIRVSGVLVEEVLKLSYSYPGPAVKFFRWAAQRLNDNPTPYAWNLVVDLLGKNSRYDGMWEAIRSMHTKGLLSLATFASVFSSYVAAGSVKLAIATFDDIEKYGCKQDIIALNSLFSAICRDGKTIDAFHFLSIVKNRISPDADTYAILLEGWENEGDVAYAEKTFVEMIAEIGWDPTNVPAYDSYLCTLLKGRNLFEALDFLITVRGRGCYPGIKFFKAILEECLKRNDARNAEVVWKEMAGVCIPDTQMYNSMITIHCYSNNIGVAIQLFDEMTYNKAFPDTQTYNVLFQFLIKSRKLREASALFNEMVKNECVLNQYNCRVAVKVYMDNREPYMAIKIWKFMIENHNSNLVAETGNLLVCELCVVDMYQEAVKYAEGLIGKGYKLTSASLSQLKVSLTRARKEVVYDRLLRKCKAL